MVHRSTGRERELAYNIHFVRDAGIGFFSSGIGLWLGVAKPRFRSLYAATIGLMYIGGHALFHLLLILLDSDVAIEIVIRELAIIILPAGIALFWLVREFRRPGFSDRLS